jgi:hypothetical protein
MKIHDEFLPEETFATCLNHMPQPCVDPVVEYAGGILLTRRQNEPAKGEWFWPGLYRGEPLDRQHDEYRVVTGPPEDTNRYVRRISTGSISCSRVRGMVWSEQYRKYIPLASYSRLE